MQESATETAEEEAEEEEEEEDEVIWTGLPASRWSQLALHPPQTQSQLTALKVLNVQQAPAALNCVSGPAAPKLCICLCTELQYRALQRLSVCCRTRKSLMMILASCLWVAGGFLNQL